jgi:hypothetical protein
LIAQNIANGSARVPEPDPNVSVLNFHYAHPPSAVGENAHFRGVIGCDETGFKGQGDSPYREEGWEFVLAGGGLYNNLDYSFTVASPDGSAKVEAPTPGGGGAPFRAGMASLKRFIESVPFVRMRPDEAVRSVKADGQVTVRSLSEPGKCVAAYVRGGSRVVLAALLDRGAYSVDWIDTLTGSPVAKHVIQHPGGEALLESPRYGADIALRVRPSR